MSAALSCSDLHYDFDGEVALAGVSLEIDAGSAVAVTGPSGCGKSTLLMCLAGVLTPSAGEVRIDGERVDTLDDDARSDLRAGRFGFVMQFGDLVPELTLEENVGVPSLIRGEPLDTKGIRSVLERLGLGGLQRRLPGEVSGGQRQRAAVARAVLRAPDIVFADEPTGALDSRNGQAVMDLLLEQCRDLGSTLVVVTHDESEVRRFDTVIQMRDGTVVG